MCCVVSRLGAALVYWPRWAPLSLHGSDRPMLSMKRRFGSAAGGSGDRCEGRRPVPDVVIAEARRLARKSPKTGQRRSLRTIAAELAALGHLALRTALPRQRHMLALASAKVGSFAEHMLPGHGAGMALERGDLRCAIAKAVRLIDVLKIFVSKYQNQEIGENSQGRYATLHLPDHVAHAMNSAPHVRQRFPSRSLKPLPTHTQGFD
jgi:hypothetical protein